MKKLIQKITTYGSENCRDENERRQNVIWNHGLLHGANVFFLTWLIEAVYFYFLLQIDAARYKSYFWPFTVVQLVPTIWCVSVYFLRHRSHANALLIYVTLVISGLNHLALFVSIGPRAGFQFFTLALFPSAYLAFPGRRWLYGSLYLLNSALLVFYYFWGLTQTPIFPIPQLFIEITFYLVIAFASAFTFGTFGYAAYKYDWLARGLGILRRIAGYGGDSSDYHKISNQIWLWNLALTASIIPLIAVLFPLFGDLLGDQRWVYLAVYGAIPAGTFGAQVFLFWWGNRTTWTSIQSRSARSLSPGLNSASRKTEEPGLSEFPAGEIVSKARRRTLALHLLITSDCAMLWLFSLCTGGAAGIHFIFPALLALPFYFFRRELHARAWLTKAFWVGAILVQFTFAALILSPPPFMGEVGRWAGWQPLPLAVTDVVRIVVVTLVVLIAMIWVAYFWWQLGVTRRTYVLWEKLSNLGIPTDLPSVERKKQILMNRGFFLVCIYDFILGPGLILVGLVLGLYYHEANVFVRMAALAAVFLSFFPIAWLIFFIRIHRGHLLLYKGLLHNWVTPIVIIFTGCQILTISIQLQDSINFALFFVASVAGLISFAPRLDHKPSLIVSLLAIGILNGITLTIKSNTPPLNPIFPWIVQATTIILYSFFAALIVLMVYYLRHEATKSESALELAHSESEKLLLNILPAEVSLELKAHGHTTPREYKSTTVLFTDFVGFTRIAESMSATELVRELDQCFSYFDNVAQKYGLEKLKTIGDAYMAAGGIPVENYTHPIDCALAALEIQAFMNQMKEIKEQQGLPYWELRLGMHTGPLVAGVVGEKKFAYDVWGDTVNTASRMESSGVPGAINISREMYEEIKFLFHCAHRGKVYAKNKGDIDMFYLYGIEKAFSVKGEGRVPNADFREVYEHIKAGARLAPAKVAEPGMRVYG